MGGREMEKMVGWGGVAATLLGVGLGGAWPEGVGSPRSVFSAPSVYEGALFSACLLLCSGGSGSGASGHRGVGVWLWGSGGRRSQVLRLRVLSSGCSSCGSLLGRSTSSPPGVSVCRRFSRALYGYRDHLCVEGDLIGRFLIEEKGAVS